MRRPIPAACSEMTSVTFFLFLVNLALGIVVLLPFVPRAEIGSGFHRFNAMTAVLLLVVATLVRFLQPADAASGLFVPSGFGLYSAVAFLAAAALYWLSLRFEADAIQRLALAAAIAAGLATVVGYARDFGGRFAEEPWLRALVFTHGLASAWVLGSVVFTMILGHWYLVVPRLSIRFLQKHSRLFVGSVLSRAALALVTIGLYAAFGWPGGFAFTAEALVSDGFFLVPRLLFGVGGALVLGALIVRTAAIGSTQSCTGILYGAVVLVLFGELSASWLLVSQSLLL